MMATAGRVLRRTTRTSASWFSSATPTTTAPAAGVLKHRPVMPLEGTYGKVAPDAFVAPSATIVGDVEVHDGASVWYNAVVRGDKNAIKVGPGSSVGDRASLSTCAALESGFPATLTVGSNVFIGAGATLISCIVESGAVIGENSVVLEGALVEAGAEVGPNSVVPPGQLVPAGELWAGNPVQLAGAAHAGHRAEDEQTLAELHRDEFLPVNTGFWQNEK